MTFKADTDKIKRWREERQWSQEHLAQAAGLGLRTVQRIENGDQASRESLRALAAAFDIDVLSLLIDPEDEAVAMLERKHAKSRAALQLSFWIHLAGYIIGTAVFVAISVGAGAFVMLWPLLWWSVGLVSHGVTVLIVEVATRYESKLAKLD